MNDTGHAVKCFRVDALPRGGPPRQLLCCGLEGSVGTGFGAAQVGVAVSGPVSRAAEVSQVPAVARPSLRFIFRV